MPAFGFAAEILTITSIDEGNEIHWSVTRETRGFPPGSNVVEAMLTMEDEIETRMDAANRWAVSGVSTTFHWRWLVVGDLQFYGGNLENAYSDPVFLAPGYTWTDENPEGEPW